MYIVTRALSLSKYLCTKTNYSMKTIMRSQEFSLSGPTNMLNKTISFYLTHKGHFLWSQLVTKAQNWSIFQPIKITQSTVFSTVSHLAAKVLKILPLYA